MLPSREFAEMVERAHMDEGQAVDFYTRMAQLSPTEPLRCAILEISRDELRHAFFFGSLLSQMHTPTPMPCPGVPATPLPAAPYPGSMPYPGMPAMPSPALPYPGMPVMPLPALPCPGMLYPGVPAAPLPAEPYPSMPCPGMPCPGMPAMPPEYPMPAPGPMPPVPEYPQPPPPAEPPKQPCRECGPQSTGQ